SKSSNQTQNGTTLSTEVSFDYDSAIPTKLTFDVKSSKKKVWLGVSLYPATVKEALKDGDHQQLELNGETSDKVIKVGKKYSGGSFEAALWGKKVYKNECTIEDCYWCTKNGFHLDELLLYKSGTFVYSHQ
ncbi:MAG: hypothetical protein HYZ34_09900, partial [Ignavibacteriae bacterium]|nr:hypothetical protein [Ignavibacteriota bacterium]